MKKIDKDGKVTDFTAKEISDRNKRTKKRKSKKDIRKNKFIVKLSGSDYSCRKQDILHYQILITYLSKSTDTISVNDIESKGKELTKTKLIELFRKATEKYLKNLI